MQTLLDDGRNLASKNFHDFKMSGRKRQRIAIKFCIVLALDAKNHFL